MLQKRAKPKKDNILYRMSNGERKASFWGGISYILSVGLAIFCLVVIMFLVFN